MSDRTICFGLIGAGAISQTYAQAFEGQSGIRLVAVADSRPEAARAMGERLGCPSFASAEALAAGASIDAVIISTPPSTHPEIAISFAARGVHVLCEKPLSINSASARAMAAEAERAGVLLTMASKFRYATDVIRAKSIATSGILGDITLFENSFTSRVDMSKRWNSNPEMSGGGVLIDNGTHSVDILRYFLGPVESVRAIEGRRVKNLGVEETVNLFVRTANGELSTVDLSWSISKERPSFIDIYGSQGVVSVGWKESRYRQASSSEWVIFGNGYDKVQAFRSQLENFAGAIRGEVSLLITAADAVASVEVIEAAYHSLHSSDWIAVAHSCVTRQFSDEGGADAYSVDASGFMGEHVINGAPTRQ